jgi:hypothetical protein
LEDTDELAKNPAARQALLELTAHAVARQLPRALCSRFDSVLFTPKISEIPSYCNYSRSPTDQRPPSAVFLFGISTFYFSIEIPRIEEKLSVESRVGRRFW